MSKLPFTASHLTQLKGFVDFCRNDPKILRNPELAFFKNYIESLGGTIPTTVSETNPESPNADEPEARKEKEPEPKQEPEVESEESDIELDSSGIIEPDSDEPQAMGDSDKDVTEEDIEKSDEKKREAIEAFGEGDFAKTVTLYTEAILLNPGSALLYAKRGQCFLKLNKPNACIRDCSRALQINPDNAAAYKFRGRAHRLLGHWEEAAQDLRNACKIDFDEQADEWLREVTPNARKLEEHRRKYDRKRAEKEMKEKLERARRAREEHAKAAKNAGPQADTDGSGGPGMADFYQFLNDPEIMQAFQDPEVAAAFQDISTNPANMIKYQNNPKISAVIKKLATKFGGGMPGGFGGGMPGGFGGGFPGGFPPSGGTGSAPRSASGDDVGLD
jgi:suppressor of tumorigenicity protein 13